MVGGGQLARMTQQASIGLGVELVVLATSPDEPAVAAGAHFIDGRPDDPEALKRLAAESDVVTFDHEGVPPKTLEALEGMGISFAPPAGAKLFAQDKAVAREWGVLGPLGFLRRSVFVVDAAGEQQVDRPGIRDVGIEERVDGRLPEREAALRADVAAALAPLEHEPPRAVAHERVEKPAGRHVEVGGDAALLEFAGLGRPPAGDERDRFLVIHRHARECFTNVFGRG